MTWTLRSRLDRGNFALTYSTNSRRPHSTPCQRDCSYTGVPPQRIRTFLSLFALALTLPLLAIAVFALNRMASLEEREIEGRALQVAQDLSGDIDRELDRATITLETLATSAALARRSCRIPRTSQPRAQA